MVNTRTLIALSTLAVAALAGCGSSGGNDDTTIAGDAKPADVQVIKRWADELRAGDVTAASERFALPTVVQNGTPPLQLTDRREIVAVNRSPPRGAGLTAAVGAGRGTNAPLQLPPRARAGGGGRGGGGGGQTP